MLFAFYIIKNKIAPGQFPVITAYLKRLYDDQRIGLQDLKDLSEAFHHALYVNQQEGYDRILAMETLPREEASHLIRELYGKFHWMRRNPKQTKLVRVSGAKLQLKIVEQPGIPTTLVILNNGEELYSVSTLDSEYKTIADNSSLIHERDKYLLWAETILAKSKLCKGCNEFKVMDEHLTDDSICFDCYMSKANQDAVDLSQMFEQKKPNVIAYKTKEQAEKYIQALVNNNIEDAGDGFVIAKGVVRSNNGRYYPVFLLISTYDSGELFGVDFVAENYESTVPREYVINYLEGGKKGLYPFTYRTLNPIPGDIHQPNWPDFS